jgi:hypothetical protein
VLVIATETVAVIASAKAEKVILNDLQAGLINNYHSDTDP